MRSSTHEPNPQEVPASPRSILLLIGVAAVAWYLHGKQPQSSGIQSLTRLQSGVEVRCDQRRVPHITAANEADLHRGLEHGDLKALIEGLQDALVVSATRVPC